MADARIFTASNVLNKLSRRDFLKLSGLAGVSLGLVACGPAAEDTNDADEGVEQAIGSSNVAFGTGSFTDIKSRGTRKHNV